LNGFSHATTKKALDQACLEGVNIGMFLYSDAELSLRESCNKIIHATTFKLIFENAMSAVPKRRFTFRNGVCHLEGV
jgi:hypothetical protein